MQGFVDQGFNFSPCAIRNFEGAWQWKVTWSDFCFIKITLVPVKRMDFREARIKVEGLIKRLF